MSKLSWKKIAFCFLLFFLLAVYQDMTESSIKQNQTVLREAAGGKDKKVSFLLNGEGIIKDYEYEITIEAAKISKEEAEELFASVIAQIEQDFANHLETCGQTLPIEESYMDDMVEADWDFGDCDCINSRGEILQEYIEEAETTVYAQVVLSCGNYESIYRFPFVLPKKELSQQEVLLAEVEAWMQQQMELEGTQQIQLPQTLHGVSLQWSEKKDSLAIQILVFEIAAALLLWWSQKKQKEQEEKKRQQSYELDYPNLVNQLYILLQTGMTTRQVWAKIAAQYQLKREKNLIPEKPVYEKILYMNRSFLEGENERTAYQKFADEVNVRSYYHLMRTLSSNLEKGSGGLCYQLGEECKQAYEQRILMAKRLGEEASTKMLLPLMGMLLLVMAVVLLPAIIGGNIL